LSTFREGALNDHWVVSIWRWVQWRLDSDRLAYDVCFWCVQASRLGWNVEQVAVGPFRVLSEEVLVVKSCLAVKRRNWWLNSAQVVPRRRLSTRAWEWRSWVLNSQGVFE
jgi:hypothetical protein